MTLKVSTGLRNAMLDTGSFKSQMDTCTLKIYAGTIPADADADITGSVLLCEIFAGGATTLTFATVASGGEITKTIAETWAGTVLVGGTATFYRLELAADDHTLSTTQKRVQGDVGLANELNLTDPVLVLSATQNINTYRFGLPT